jgi:hypothetical protein
VAPRQLRFLVLLVPVGLAFALIARDPVGPGPVEAAFPGANGKIAFLRQGVWRPARRLSDYQLVHLWTVRSGLPMASRSGSCSTGSRLSMSRPVVGERSTSAPSASGSSARRAASVRDRSIAWSPDGRKIAVSRRCRISVVDVDGGGLRDVTSPGRNACDTLPAWQPITR